MMQNRLPVKANHGDLTRPVGMITAKRFNGLDMALMDDGFYRLKAIGFGTRKLPCQSVLGRLLQSGFIFISKISAQARAEAKNALAIRLQKRRVNAIQGCAAHKTERYVAWLFHIYPFDL